MSSISLAFVLFSVVPLICAFIVDFNAADLCVGLITGQYQGTGGQGCQFFYGDANNSSNNIVVPGDSFNVYIHPEDNDNKTAVAFYGEGNCQTLVALGNVPTCVGIGPYKSFQVINLAATSLGWTNLEPAPVQSLPPNTTIALSSSEALTETVSATLTVNTSTVLMGLGPLPPPPYPPGQKRGVQRSPISRNNRLGYIEQMRNGKPIAHGAVRRSAGKVYVYQQIAKKAWRGVPSEQWDPKVHKRNTVNIASSTYPLHRRSDGVSRRDLGPLLERAVLSTSCNLVRSCMIDSGDDPNFSISNVGAELLDAIHALNPNDDDWTWLQAPFVVQITESDVSDTSLGFIYAQTLQHSEMVNICSDTGTQRDALQAAFALGADGTTASDMRVDLNLLDGPGKTNSLFVSTRSASNSDTGIHPICEAVQVNF